MVKKSGAWYTYEAEQLGQGKENSRTYLIENPKLADEIEKKIKAKLGIGVPRAVADLPADAVEEKTPAKAAAKVAVEKVAEVEELPMAANDA